MTAATPSVSVVVPTRDQASRLSVTLRAFASQDVPRDDWEIVVVDDGSRDGTADVLAAAGDLPLRAVRTPPRGRAAARNHGVREASGELIVFCDGDRAPVPGYVRAHAEAHTGSAHRVVVGDVRELYVSDFDTRAESLAGLLTAPSGGLDRGARTPAFVKKVCGVYDSAGTTTSPVRWLSFLSGNVSLPRRLFARAGGFDEDFTEWGLEHLELGYRLVRLGAEYRHCRSARNHHFAHRRPVGFYEASLEASAQVFARKHPEFPEELLLDLTLRGMSLQEFERRAADERRAAWARS
ncbi:glycosyltransferase family 2 protein [Streptomyces sp. MB09-02B]|uniref:glycosyltransferase family 2 protein n=1 Tax=Streptomyces sp. MB09-02B TaxID=3028667 RepID=UPI0029A021E8|nr:glycosyltransferase [Streptomyces sp. MB09-02B]MDX3640004.1 glycosyltransferase [Streptomyces sp. MB09-02B]